MIDYKTICRRSVSAMPTRWKNACGASAGPKSASWLAGKELAGLIHAMSCSTSTNNEPSVWASHSTRCQTFPLDMKGFHSWAEGLIGQLCRRKAQADRRVQIKEGLVLGYASSGLWLAQRRCAGWSMATKRAVSPPGAPGPDLDRRKLRGHLLIEEGRNTGWHQGRMERWIPHDVPITPKTCLRVVPVLLVQAVHITQSNQAPEGSRRLLRGSVCQLYGQWMDRETTALPHMGGERGELESVSPSSHDASMCPETPGTGTLQPLGNLAIRAARGQDEHYLQEIMYNDARCDDRWPA